MRRVLGGCLLMTGLLHQGMWAQRETAGPAAEVSQMIRQRNLDAAIARANADLKIHRRDDTLWTLKAIALEMKGDSARAAVAFDEALRLAPRNLTALRGLIQLLYAKDDSRTPPLLERVLEIAPADPVAREMLANVQARDGQCKQAVDNFQKVAAAVETHIESQVLYAGCLMKQQRPDEAVDIFKRLNEAYPDRPGLQYDLALALHASNRKQEAVSVVEHLLKSDRSPDTLALASEIYESAGETPTAVDLLRRAIVANPTNAQYYVSFTALCLAHESFDAGIQMVQAGLARIQNDPSLYISRGLLLAQTAKYKEAEADFATAEKLDASQSVSTFATDIAELQRKQSTLAAGDLRRQVLRYPQSALLHLLLAKTLWTEKGGTGSAPEEAIREARTAISLQPTLTEAYDLLADIYLAANANEESIKQSTEALRLDPEDQTALYHLIVAYRHSPDERLKAKLPELVRRLSEMKRLAREDELRRKSFSLHTQLTP